MSPTFDPDDGCPFCGGPMKRTGTLAWLCAACGRTCNDEDDTAVELCVFVQGRLVLEVHELSRGAHYRAEPHVHQGVPGFRVYTTDQGFYERLIGAFHVSK